MEETKICSKCGRELPRSEFATKSKSKDGLQSYCRDCIREASRKNYEKRKNLLKSTRDEIIRHDGMELLQVYSNPELAKFTPRELMVELKARGFRWDYMLEPQRKIMFEKLR